MLYIPFSTKCFAYSNNLSCYNNFVLFVNIKKLLYFLITSLYLIPNQQSNFIYSLIFSSLEGSINDLRNEMKKLHVIGTSTSFKIESNNIFFISDRTNRKENINTLKPVRLNISLLSNDLITLIVSKQIKVSESVGINIS